MIAYVWREESGYSTVCSGGSKLCILRVEYALYYVQKFLLTFCCTSSILGGLYFRTISCIFNCYMTMQCRQVGVRKFYDSD